MGFDQPTNAASSGVVLDRKVLKSLARRSDLHGLRHLAIWLAMLSGSTLLLYLSQESLAFYPAMLLQATLLTVPVASLSHETCHGTAFKTRWLNELVYWIVSFLYIEPPTIHRYAHTRHHTYTWVRGLDAQMTHNPPLTLRKWIEEFTSYNQFSWDFRFMVLSSFGRIDPDVLDYVPKQLVPRLKWESRLFLLGYAGVAAAIFVTGALWPVIYIILPRFIGGFVWQLYVIVMHSEMRPDCQDIRESTRSFTTNWFSRFIYSNMSYHIEHHLYPMVPFHALPKLSAALADQIPQPDKGLFRTNAQILSAVLKRSFRKNLSPEAG